MSPHRPLIQENVLLAPHTTIRLGGAARYFAECLTLDDITEALTFARRHQLRVHILGGGSNVIFPDRGFDGLVLKVSLKSVLFEDRSKQCVVTAAAGEVWDDLVARCIERGLGGIECLSGIPGFTGATPIQNVGAYGQEVRETIISVQAVDCATLQPATFSNDDCLFAYRWSRFKGKDAGRYIITSVAFRLNRNATPEIRYTELQAFVQQRNPAGVGEGREGLRAVRDAVLSLRRRKSMVIDSSDPYSRSVGSFFMNPILSHEAFSALQDRWRVSGDGTSIPTFPAEGGVKVPAAWLVERAGYTKGFRRGGVGVSAHHALALVNFDGSASELLALAAEIQQTVYTRFAVQLEREPVVVSSTA